MERTEDPQATRICDEGQRLCAGDEVALLAEGTPSSTLDIREGKMPRTFWTSLAVAGGALFFALLLLLAVLTSGSGSSPFGWLHLAEKWVQGMPEAVEGLGRLAPLYYAGAYVVATVMLLPASPLTVAAGYIFGTFKGTALVSVASTIGACLAFLIARYAARPMVVRQLAKSTRFANVDMALMESGARVVFLWRLSPLFPFALSNYMFGLTAVGFWEYLIASWLGMLPASFAYVYLGEAGRATVESITDDRPGGGLSLLKLSLYLVGAVATFLVMREVSARASQALKKAEEPGPGAAA